jgi:rod shape-determining protein MreC
MNWLNFNFKKALILLVAVLLPLISLNNEYRPVGNTWYNQPFTFLGSLVEESFFSFSDNIRTSTRMYLNLVNIKKQNQDLKETNHKLQAELQKTLELESENSRLRKLLDLKSTSKMELVTSEVISRDLLSDHETLVINKGTQDGLKEGMPVIAIGGVVGYIFRPQLYTARILLISDRYSVVDGIITRNRIAGIVEGKGRQECLLRYVEKSQDIQVGDQVVTSGLDNIFPKGLPVAKVTAVTSKPHSASLIVEMLPSVDPNQVEEVFIITNANSQQGALSK